MSQAQSAPVYDGGQHNADLEKSSLRVLQGGSWKKQRIVVLLPASDMISTRVMMNCWSLMFPPNQAVHRMLCQGMEVGDAYSTAIAEIVDNPGHPCHDWDYILTIEHDNMPPADGVVKLLHQMEAHPEYATIGGLYWCKGPGGCAHIWGEIADPVVNYRPQVPRAGELIECYGTSMGFNLWRMSLFKDKRLARPWFKTLDGSEGKGIGTQDLSFWSDARKYGYRCAVDCGVPVGHIDYSGSFGEKGKVW